VLDLVFSLLDLQDNVDTIEAVTKKKTRYSEKEVIRNKLEYQGKNKVPLSNGKKVEKNNKVCISFPAKSLFV
jgi:hypothetical protein